MRWDRESVSSSVLPCFRFRLISLFRLLRRHLPPRGKVLNRCPHNLPLWGRWHGESRDGRGQTGSPFSLFRLLRRHLPPRGKVLVRWKVESPHNLLSGPRQSPAKRVCWGEEEQGSGGRATSGSPNRSGLCDDVGRWHGVAVTEEDTPWWKREIIQKRT